MVILIVVGVHFDLNQANCQLYFYPIHWLAPSWLVSSIGRALHRYRRGHGFKSRTGLNFFQVLFTTTSFSSVLSCEDLLISSLHRSANMWVLWYFSKCPICLLHLIYIARHKLAPCSKSTCIHPISIVQHSSRPCNSFVLFVVWISFQLQKWKKSVYYAAHP